MSKGTDIVMVRVQTGFTPYGDSEWDKLDKIPLQKKVLIRIIQPRNPQHTAKLWAIAGKVANFSDEFVDARHAIDWVLEELGMCERIVRQRRDGTVEVRLTRDSISEESMDQTSFNRFYDRAIYLWSQRIGCDPEELT